MNIANDNSSLIRKPAFFEYASYVLLVLIVIFRRPDAFYDAQFWGEEGSVFYAEAYHQGISSLFHTCGGYFHLIPRLLSLICIQISLPLHLVPFVFTYTWLAILIFLARYLWVKLNFSVWQKFCMVLSLMIIPIQSEVVINQTNMQWILAVFLLALLFLPHQNKSNFYPETVLIVLFGLTGPNLTVMLPLLIWKWYVSYKEKNFDKTGLWLLGVAVTLGLSGAIAIATSGGFDRTQGEFHMFNTGFVQYFFIQYAFLFVGKISTHIPVWIMFCGAMVFLLFFVYIIKTWVIDKKDKVVWMLLAFGWLFLISSLVAYRHQPDWPNPYYNSTRNFYLPALSLVWLIIYLAGYYKNGATVLSALMILFSFELLVFIGSEKLEDNKLEKFSNKVTTTDTLSIPINPEGWRIYIDNSKVKH